MPVSRWSRFARRLGVLSAVFIAVATALAQSLGFQTLAGSTGLASPFSNTAPITFNNPYGVAVDSSGNVYVADTSNHVIRRITAAGAVSTLAGVPGTAGTADDPGGATLARFNSPQGVALNADGDRVYVADTGSHTIRVIALSAAGGSVTSVATLAGTAGTTGTSNTGAGTFNTPRGIAADSAGNLYIADTGNHLVRKIVISGPTVSTVAGLAGNTTFANGNSTVATFNTPYGVAVSADNNTLYVADFGNHAVRKIALTPSVDVTTLAGAAGAAGFIDATGTAAAFRNPTGVAVNAAGNVLVMDFGNNALRQIAIADSAVTTIAGPAATGTTTAGASGFANGSGTAVRFTGPVGVAAKTVSGTAYVYVADTNNHLIRQGAVPSNPTVGAASPASQTASIGANGITFAATVTGGWPAPTLQWQIQPGGVGSFQNITASSTYQNVNTTTLTINGVTAAMNNDKFRLVATSGTAVEGAAATLVVNQAPNFASDAVSFTAVVGRTSSFIVAASGTSPITYSGTLNSTFPVSSSGAITGTPTSTSESTSGTITATNSVGSDTQTVTINVVAESSAAAPTITSAAAANFATNQANNFTFTASGAPTPLIGLSGTLPAGVTFVNGLLSGTPTSTDGSPFTLTVSASNALGTVTQTFTLSVTASATAPTISTQPSNTIVNHGANATFTAVVTGSPTPTLRWQRQPSAGGGFADLFNDSTFSGTETATLTITNVQPGMSGDQYRLVATNSAGSATSSTATLTVNIGTSISTFAGGAGLAGATDATGLSARFNTPAGIAVDVFGNFYVADAANHVIRKITPSGVVTTLAGMAGSLGSADGTGSEARFSGPSAIAVNAVGTVFVADTYNHTIRSITPNGVVTTIAGLAGNSGNADGVGTAARFSFPSGVVADGLGNLYVSDSSNHTIRRIQSLSTVTTFAGSAGVAGTTDGTGAAARFNYPAHLAIDASGNVYVADSLNHTVRRITSGGTVSTLAGAAGVAGAADANGTAATFNRPTGIAVDSSGNVFVADTNNSTIRRISSAGTVTTVAGSPGATGTTDGAGNQARFNQPFSLVVDTNGNLFIADTRNHTIRRSGTTSAPGITTQPQNTVVPVGGTTTFTVVATGTPAPSYQWQRQPANTVGFVNLSNGLGYSGVNSATLTVSNVLSSQSGDQFRVVLSNGVNPSATSDAATLTIGEAPVFTSAANATVRATDALNFTFTASGSPSSTFTATPLPSWASLSSAGVLSGTPPAGSEGTYTFTVTANNGATATQTFTLTVTPAIVAPTITAQPVAVSVNQGQSATFNVTAAGTAPLSYQWRRNGASILGATGSSYTIGNAQLSTAGTYSVTITNTGGSVVSSDAELIVNTPPVFTAQPRTQTALAGSTVTFSAGATGAASFNYQWRRDGVPIEGATNATLTLTGVTAANSGLYDVQVSNALGLVTSSIAQLTVTSTPSAPVITAQPASRTIVVGGATTLSVGATGAPAPSYQWRKDGVNISGANAPTYLLSGVRPSDGGSYDVVISNSAGSVTSAAATLRVAARSYAGIYLGTFMGAGDFGLYVRDDNTAVLIGHLGNDVRTPIIATNLVVDDDGRFSFAQVTPAIFVNGVISTNGNVGGSLSGVATAQVAGSRAADTGSSQSYTGFYQAGAAGNGTTVYAIVAATGQGHVVARSGTSSIGSLVPVSSNGQIMLANAFGTVALTIDASIGIASGSVTIGSATAQVSGGSDAALQQQRLINISSRARVGTGDSVAIAGFVISGEESKPVLIRAVGPTLGAAPFNIPGVLASPRLELFRATGATNTSIAVNTGISGNRAAIDLASSRAGAFALGASGNDAALLLTLAPGNYTASVSSTTNAAGVALIEVYDLTAPAPGQKMLNISTRASAGSAENTLIAGFVVPPGSAKRVLVRGIGPGLAQFGVTGVLAQPTLTLINNATGNTLATNTNWNTSVDAAALSPASNQVGGFPLANNDSALIATLPPGNYTAQVVGAGGATGIALIEVYELP